MCNNCYKKHIRENIVKVKCLCGCGTLIPAKTRSGKPNYFAPGHNFRGMFNPQLTAAQFKTEDGHLVIRKVGHPNATPNGYVLNDRLVMEKELKRYLQRNEIVEHKNGDNGDDRIENLYIVDIGLITSREKRVDMRNRQCSDPDCKSPNETQNDKDGNPNWFKSKDGNWLCKRCYNRLKNRENRKK
jgi:hypothetical protein